jgi:eukaryotic-like serine/threonine-protein kinase
LLAQPVDPNTFALAGDPVTLVDDVSVSAGGRAAFSVSRTGVVAYEHQRNVESQLTWVDRTGKELDIVGKPGIYSTIDMAPDEHRVAVGLMDPGTVAVNLWVMDLERPVASRLTYGTVRESDPAWSPDSRRIAFNSIRNGLKSLYAMSPGGGSEEELLRSSGPPLAIDDWSKDGRFVLYHIDSTRELWALPLAGDRKPILVMRTLSGTQPDEANFSPDGKWVAYNTSESGRMDVYIAPFPPTGDKWQISSAGGAQPRWRGDGRELFYFALDGTMMVTGISADAGTIHPSSPRELFHTSVFVAAFTEQYAVSADGQRFLMMKPTSDASAVTMTVIVNWHSGLAARETR